MGRGEGSGRPKKKRKKTLSSRVDAAGAGNSAGASKLSGAADSEADAHVTQPVNLMFHYDIGLVTKVLPRANLAASVHPRPN